MAQELVWCVDVGGLTPHCYIGHLMYRAMGYRMMFDVSCDVSSQYITARSRYINALNTAERYINTANTSRYIKNS